MAWRLNQAVVRGEIDNRIKDVVTGRIWLAGIERPIELKLEGNCHRDMAGHLLTFKNPNPVKPDDEHINLNPIQNGLVGDLTASRKVRVFDIPLEDALARYKQKKRPPEHLANCLYLEWYSNFNGRVVIESTDYLITISDPTWLMTEEEAVEQCKANGEAIVKWMERLTGAVSATQRREEIDAAEDKTWSADDSVPMDEFEWGKFMKKSDARTDKLMELYVKYENIEDEEQERLIAREMGWDHIEEVLDAKSGVEFPNEDSGRDVPDEYETPEPDLLTEGIDWIRDDMGRPVHPLYRRTLKIVIGMRHDCEEAGLLGENGNKAVQDMIFSSQMINAKLASALNSLWMDRDRDGGFIVANLKRTLKYFNEAMGHYQKVQEEELAPTERLERFHTDLCAVREEILHLMDKYRGGISGSF